MLSIEKAKKLINDPTLSDDQVKEVRDDFYFLVGDIIFPKWLEDRKKQKNNKSDMTTL